MRRLLYATVLAMLAMLILAPAAAAQDLYDCPDFATQEEAQQFLLPGDPYGLDADNDGMACDDRPSGGSQQPQMTQPQQQSTPAATSLPQSGGISLLLPATVLLVSSSLLALTVSRRS